MDKVELLEELSKMKDFINDRMDLEIEICRNLAIDNFEENKDILSKYLSDSMYECRAHGKFIFNKFFFRIY